jgi:hypothetical protein
MMGDLVDRLLEYNPADPVGAGVLGGNPAIAPMLAPRVVAGPKIAVEALLTRTPSADTVR